mmetsp:Transcript_12519/g.36961  ORF Transcript_12519/g.36961 Transcript_12519/m.36961 type:complete len:359 (+) Transcript_12519:681-1757(+)
MASIFSVRSLIFASRSAIASIEILRSECNASSCLDWRSDKFASSASLSCSRVHICSRALSNSSPVSAARSTLSSSPDRADRSRIFSCASSCSISRSANSDWYLTTLSLSLVTSARAASLSSESLRISSPCGTSAPSAPCDDSPPSSKDRSLSRSWALSCSTSNSASSSWYWTTRSLNFLTSARASSRSATAARRSDACFVLAPMTSSALVISRKSCASERAASRSPSSLAHLTSEDADSSLALARLASASLALTSACWLWDLARSRSSPTWDRSASRVLTFACNRAASSCSFSTSLDRSAIPPACSSFSFWRFRICPSLSFLAAAAAAAILASTFSSLALSIFTSSLASSSSSVWSAT